ncbi:MAG: hypothetical protein GF399_09620 [Candidatus Coatesbacteria bacterium]|nr:hypothetical protein [Candidatus Coatesbacteria bacterium]
MNKEEIYRELFGEHNKTDMTPRRYNESLYSFYCRTGRAGFEKAREFICSEIEYYSDDDKNEYISRITKDHDLTSSSFELIIKRFIEKHNYRVIHHASVNNINSKPDFYIVDKNAYLECICIKEKEAIGTNKIEQHRFEEELTRLLQKGDYYIHIEFDKFYIPKNLSIKQHIRSIKEWIESCIKIKARDNIYYIPNTSIQLIFYYKKGYNGPLIPTVGSGIVCMGNINERTRDKLSKKANKVKGIDTPYIIAFNSLMGYTKQGDILEMLYGDIAINYRISSNGRSLETKNVRLSNGLWHYNYAPNYSRISGIIVFKRLYPDSFLSSDPTLYINPFASKPINSDVFNCKVCYINEKKSLETKEGKPLHEILDMPPNWPND